jgi:RHS repeat-associated protein
VWDPLLNGGAGDWKAEPDVDRRYVYDGWNLLVELDGLDHDENGSPDNVTLNTYCWGLDLSGLSGGVNGFQGAGGVGGLLAFNDTKGTPGDTTDDDGFIYFADAMGNIGQVVGADSGYGGASGDAWDTGRLAARYEYDPYGNATVATGDYAELNPFRFSTKWFGLTGAVFGVDINLGDWSQRWYAPHLGRWINRDPIGELGGVNLYQYAFNSPPTILDILGLLGDELDKLLRRIPRPGQLEQPPTRCTDCHNPTFLGSLVPAREFSWQEVVNDACQLGVATWGVVNSQPVQVSLAAAEIVVGFISSETGIGAAAMVHGMFQLEAALSECDSKLSVFTQSLCGWVCDRVGVDEVIRDGYVKPVAGLLTDVGPELFLLVRQLPKAVGKCKTLVQRFLKRGAADADELVQVQQKIAHCVGEVSSVRPRHAQGRWIDSSESMSARARAYHEQITGRAGQSYSVGGVKFDGVLDDVLIEAKGPGYSWAVRNGRFRTDFDYQGASKILSQARRQVSAACGKPIQWHVAEADTAIAIQNLFADHNIIGITVIHTPVVP